MKFCSLETNPARVLINLKYQIALSLQTLLNWYYYTYLKLLLLEDFVKVNNHLSCQKLCCILRCVSGAIDTPFLIQMVRALHSNQKVTGSNPTRHSPDFGTQPRYEALGETKSVWWIENGCGMRKNENEKWNCSKNETKLRIPGDSNCLVTQSWLWCNRWHPESNSNSSSNSNIGYSLVPPTSEQSLREKCPYSELCTPYIFRVNILRIQSKCAKIRTRLTPNTDTFYAVDITRGVGCLNDSGFFSFIWRQHF